MLIKESQLRAIIREELIREHQQLMLEFSIKSIADKMPKVLPAIILMLSANAMSACNQLKDSNISDTDQAAIEIGIMPDPNTENTHESAAQMDDIKQATSDGVKACEDIIKYMQNNDIENEPLRNQADNAIKMLKSSYKQIDKGFVPKNEEEREKLINLVTTQGRSICQNLDDMLHDHPGTFDRLGKEHKKKKNKK